MLLKNIMLNIDHIYYCLNTNKMKRLFASLTLVLVALLYSPQRSLAAGEVSGENLFINHCAGCHMNGGNIIRRRKTLKIEALKNNGLDNPEAIARVARNGIGIMSGYEQNLGKEGDKIVADWIWTQAQNAWTQG